jgi:hypothetical protein
MIFLANAATQTALDKVTDAITMGIVATIALAFSLLMSWMRSRFSGPVQREAALQGAIAAETQSAEVKAATGKPLTSAQKKKIAVAVTDAKTPIVHKPLIPGATGRNVERALPEMRRESEKAPPPTE